MTGVVVHVLNRAARRATLFEAPRDYAAFEAVLEEALERIPLRILAFCVMPNHWHLVAWPSAPGQLSAFLHWLTLAHAVRWHAARGTTGLGPVYQGRFKSFPVQSDGHVLRACRYVERNALRAGLVQCAEDWRWGSLWRRAHPSRAIPLSEGPVPLPADWLRRVNEPESPAELAALRTSARRGAPLGAPRWVESIAREWGLGATLRERGSSWRRLAADSSSASPDPAPRGRTEGACPESRPAR